MLKAKKLIAILLIETFFLSSILPFSPQDLFADGSSKLAPPLSLSRDNNNSGNPVDKRLSLIGMSLGARIVRDTVMGALKAFEGEISKDNLIDAIYSAVSGKEELKGFRFDVITDEPGIIFIAFGTKERISVFKVDFKDKEKAKIERATAEEIKKIRSTLSPLQKLEAYSLREASQAKIRRQIEPLTDTHPRSFSSADGQFEGAVETMVKVIKEDASVRGKIIRALGVLGLTRGAQRLANFTSSLKKAGVSHNGLFGRAVELLNRLGTFFRNDIENKNIVNLIVSHAAPLLDMQADISGIPPPRPGLKLEAKESEALLDIVQEASRAAFLFTNKSPKFSELNLYESLCFINDEGTRKLAVVLTPMAKRPYFDKWRVIILESDKKGEYPKKELKLSDLEMISEISERMELTKAYKHMLKFKVKALREAVNFGTPETREVEIAKFIELASPKKLPYSYIEEAEKVIGRGFSEVTPKELSNTAGKLKSGKITSEELNAALNNVLVSKPEILKYLQFTGDATGAWYLLLHHIRIEEFVRKLWLVKSAAGDVDEKRLLVAESAYEYAVISAWIQMHKGDFIPFLGERGAQVRTQDFGITMLTTNFGDPTAPFTAQEAMDYLLCEDCAWNPCRWGQQGSLAIKSKRQAEFIGFILGFMESAGDKDLALNYLDNILNRFREKAVKLNIAESKGGENKSTNYKLIDEWLNMTKAELTAERGRLRAAEKETQVGLMDEILGLMEHTSASDSDKAIEYLDNIGSKLRRRAETSNIAGDQKRRSEPNLALVNKWLVKSKKELVRERRRLFDKYKREWAKAQKGAAEGKENFCPLHVPIPDLFRLMSEGKFEEAVLMLMDASFGGAYLGLICPQEYLCQAACTLRSADGTPIPIDIGKLEYLIVQTYLRLNNGKLPKPKEKPKLNGKSVVILGSGPAGLQQAYDLVRKGYRVVVMEALHKAGGVLGYGIPTSRLQEGLVDEHVRYLKEEWGVEFVLDTQIGENRAFTIEELREMFDGVFISTGAGKSRVMEYKGRTIPGRHLNGIFSAYHFLSWTYLMKAMTPGYDTPPPLSVPVMEAFERAIETGEEQEVVIAVLGVGNVALDSARTALRWINVLNRRMGTKVKPTIEFFYRRPEDHLRMKARAEELRHTLEEGEGIIDIKVYALHQVVEYIEDEKGNVGEIKCIRYKTYGGAVENDDVRRKVHMVIEALGAKPATETLGGSIPLDNNGYIKVESLESMRVLPRSGKLAPVYAAGDCAQNVITEEVVEGGAKKNKVIEAEPEGARGTAVNAAAQGKRAAHHFIEEDAEILPKERKGIENPEELFFSEKPYGMYEILEVIEVGYREMRGLGPQRSIEFVGYAPNIERSIQAGQIFTVMAYEHSEKIPITFLGKGKEPGTIRFTVQDLGKSTRDINELKTGQKFFSISGPGGEPSVHAGLIGEDLIVGLGGATPTDVAIVRARAELDKEITGLLDFLRYPEKRQVEEVDKESFVLSTDRLLGRLRLPKPQEIRDIEQALNIKDFDGAQKALRALAGYAKASGADKGIVGRITELQETALRMIKYAALKKDKDKLQAELKYIVYPELDRLWRDMEKQQLENFRRSVGEDIEAERYLDAATKIEGFIGVGIKTKVVLGAADAGSLLYREELEGYVGKGNIYIALEGLEIELYKEIKKISFLEYDRIVMPEAAREIIDALDNREFNAALESLSKLIEYARELNASNQIIDRATELHAKAKAIMEDSVLNRDEAELQKYMKGGILPGLDRLWRDLDEYRKDYSPEAIELKNAVKVAVDKAIGEGYYSGDSEETRFFFGYGTLPYRALIKRAGKRRSAEEINKRPHFSGALVAGPPFAMHIFVDEAEAMARADILNPWDVWLSINSPMYCIYGGCLYCILLTDEKTIIRGCLGPEFVGKRIDKKAFINRLRPTSPHGVLEKQIPPLTLEQAELELGRGLTALYYYNVAVDKLIELADAGELEGAVMFADKTDGALYAVVAVDEKKVSLIPVYGGDKKLTMKKSTFVREKLPNIDTEKLGIISEKQKTEYFGMVINSLGITGNSIILATVAFGIQGISGGSGVPARTTKTDATARKETVSKFLGGRRGDFNVDVVRYVPNTSLIELSLSSGVYQFFLPLLRKHHVREGKTELPDDLRGHEFIVIKDIKSNSFVAVMLRNRTRTDDQIVWSLGDRPGAFLGYMANLAQVKGKRPFDKIKVEEIGAKGDRGLLDDVSVKAGTSVWQSKESWSTLLTELVINFAACNECGKCAKACGEDAVQRIFSSTGDITMIGIDPTMCVRCEACRDACNMGTSAIVPVRREDSPLYISMDSTSEGRTVRLGGHDAKEVGSLLRSEKLDLLKGMLGTEKIDIVVRTSEILQASYAKDGIHYLITYVKDNGEDVIIIKPKRTMVVLGFRGDNRKLAETLRVNGFASVVVLAEGQDDFGKLKEEAVSSGFEVYSVSREPDKDGKRGVARNVKTGALLTQVSRDVRLANPITVEPDELLAPLGKLAFASFISKIREFNRASFIWAARPVPTKDKDLDAVMEKFRPSFDEEDRTSAAGGTLCPGCGQPPAVKIVLEALSKYPVVVSVATGCLQVSSSGFPFITWLVNAMHLNYTAAAGGALGVAKAARWFKRIGKWYKGAKAFIPVVFMGDGGLKIGLSVVSSALLKANVMIVVSDNGINANTGAQPTETAPWGAIGPGHPGMVFAARFLLRKFAEAHGKNVYYARVSEFYPDDFRRKVELGARWIAAGKGPVIIDVHNSACPTGWKADFTKMPELAKAALASGRGEVLYEIINGKLRLTDDGGIGPYDGKIYLNSQYLEGTRYQMEGLVLEGRITRDEMNGIMTYLTKKKEEFLMRELDEAGFGDAASGESLLEEFGRDEILEQKALAIANNMMFKSDKDNFKEHLLGMGLNSDEINKLITFRSKERNPIFESRNQFEKAVGERAYKALLDSVFSNMGADEIRALEDRLATAGIGIGAITEADAPKGTGKRRQFMPFERIDELYEKDILSKAAFDKIKNALAFDPEGRPEYRRPPVIVSLNEGRFAGIRKNRKMVDELQEGINKDLRELLEQAERDSAYFTELGDEWEEIVFPVDVSEELPEVKTAEELHDELIGKIELLKFRDEARNKEVEEQNKVRQVRLSKMSLDFRIHGLGGQGAVTSALALAELSGVGLGLRTQGMPLFGGERLNAPVKAFYRVSGREIKDRTPITAPNIVSVLNENMIKQVPVTEGLSDEDLEEIVRSREEIISSFRPGGILVVNTSRTPEEIRRELIAQGADTRGISIFTIDATKIAADKNYIGNPKHVNFIMAAAVIKISQITRLDLDAEISIDFLAKYIARELGESLAQKNRKAMEAALVDGVIKIEGNRPFSELRAEYLASLEPVDVGKVSKRKSNRLISTVVSVLDSNKAAALAAIQAGVNYCAGYPIFPSTGGTEAMAKYAEKGLLEFDILGSEDAVISAILGAALAGMRATTFTASVGLTYMFQHLPDIWGKRIPIVINVPVRALNIGTLSIFPDESDIVTVKDYGIFLRARNSQEAYDMNLIGWRIAEKMRMPVYVVYTGTLNSHTSEDLEIFTDYKAIEEYVGKRRDSIEDTILDQKNPRFHGPVSTPEITHELITKIQYELEYDAPRVIAEAFEEFERKFGVRYSKLSIYTGDDDNILTERNLDEIKTGSVDELLIASGANEITIRGMVDELKAQGRNVAVLNVTWRFPFPKEEFRQIIRRLKPKAVLILDNEKGANLHESITSALYGVGRPGYQIPVNLMAPVVYGLGGKPLLKSDIKLLYDTLEAIKIIMELGRVTEGVQAGDPVTTVPIDEKWLDGIIARETVRLEDVERYIDEYNVIRGKFEALSNLNPSFTKKEREALALTPPEIPKGTLGSNEIAAWKKAVDAYWLRVRSKTHTDFIASARLKQDAWRRILEAKQAGIPVVNPGVNSRVFNKMLRAINAEISEKELKDYHAFKSRVIEGNKPGDRNIGTLISMVDRTSGDLAHLKKKAIIRKLVATDFGADVSVEEDSILMIFGKKYMFGARSDKFIGLHELLIELSIRVAGRLLERDLLEFTDKERDTRERLTMRQNHERLMAAECLLDLSGVPQDWELAARELRRLKSLRAKMHQPLAQRALELLEIHEAKLQSVIKKPIKRGGGNIGRGLEHIWKGLGEDKTREFTILEIFALQEEVLPEDKWASETTFRLEGKGLLALGLIEEVNPAIGNTAAVYQLDERVRSLSKKQFEILALMNVLKRTSLKDLTDDEITALREEVDKSLELIKMLSFDSKTATVNLPIRALNIGALTIFEDDNIRVIHIADRTPQNPKVVFFDPQVLLDEQGRLIEGADVILEALKEKGIKPYVLTAEDANTILTALRSAGISDGILEDDNVLGNVESKQATIETVIAKEDAQPNQSVYIGVDANDILEAKKAGVIAVAFLRELGLLNSVLDSGVDYLVNSVQGPINWKAEDLIRLGI